MRIDDRDLTGAAAAESGRAAETQKSGRGGPGRASWYGERADRVELSPGLAELARALSVSGTDRASRVEALGALYASGGYQPSPAAISQAMVSEALSAARG